MEIAKKILEAKEKQYLVKQELAIKYQAGVISVMLNISYPDRMEGIYENVFVTAVNEVMKILQINSIGINEILVIADEYNRCAAISVRADAILIKRLCVQIENNHKWGRLFDLDVLDYRGWPVKRSEIGIGQRRCLVCDSPAVECIISKKHSKDDLMKQIKRILN